MSLIEINEQGRRGHQDILNTGEGKATKRDNITKIIVNVREDGRGGINNHRQREK